MFILKSLIAQLAMTIPAYCKEQGVLKSDLKYIDICQMDASFLKKSLERLINSLQKEGTYTKRISLLQYIMVNIVQMQLAMEHSQQKHEPLSINTQRAFTKFITDLKVLLNLGQHKEIIAELNKKNIKIYGFIRKGFLTKDFSYSGILIDNVLDTFTLRGADISVKLNNIFNQFNTTIKDQKDVQMRLLEHEQLMLKIKSLESTNEKLTIQKHKCLSNYAHIKQQYLVVTDKHKRLQETIEHHQDENTPIDTLDPHLDQMPTFSPAIPRNSGIFSKFLNAGHHLFKSTPDSQFNDTDEDAKELYQNIQVSLE